MRKNHIALSIAALIGGLGAITGASANVIVATNGGALGAGSAPSSEADTLVVTPGGVGHMLVIPYFTTQNGNSTLINLVNTDTVRAKAVKVRFRGAANSDDIFDFQVYMSPGDVWTANVSQDAATGLSKLSTTDKSCTLPSTVNANFVTDRLPTTMTASERAAQTREGYIEIFNMADIDPAQSHGTTGLQSGTNALFTAVKHVAGAAPCTATTMGTLTKNPATQVEAYALGLNAPSTGLFGNYTIINVPNTTTFSGEAIAIQANSGTNAAGGLGNIVFFPQTGASVTAANVNLFTADPSLRTTAAIGAGSVQNGGGAAVTNSIPVVTALMFDLPDLSTPYLSTTDGTNGTHPIQQALALTGALAVKTISNEFITDSTISAKTDWVLSMPTRRYSVALDYRTSPFSRVFTNLTGAVAGNASYFTKDNTSVVGGQICVGVDAQNLYDREETTATTGFVISPGTATAVSICGEANVLSFNAGGATAPSVLGSTVARKDLDAGAAYVQGWAKLTVNGPADWYNNAGATAAQSKSAGLPITGAAFVKATNPGVSAGVSGNFGGTWSHRYTK